MHIKEIETLDKFKEIVYKIEDTEYRNGNHDFILNKKWTIAGVSGGSCWDLGDEERDPHYDLLEEDEPEDNTIAIILKNMLPEISLNSFLKNNESWQFWDDDTDLDCDYYGNYTRFRTKTLKMDILFEKMKTIVA